MGVSSSEKSRENAVKNAVKTAGNPRLEISTNNQTKMVPSYLDSHLLDYLLIPFLIFLARVTDVTIGTIRIILVARGKKNIAPVLGFVEVFIWILVISRIMQNLDNYVNYIAYAGGFAIGNYVGMLIEDKIAMGVLIVRLITQRPADILIQELVKMGCGVTSIDAHGAREDVHVIYSVINRSELKQVLTIIKQYDPLAFYSIEDVRYVNEGVFSIKHPFLSRTSDGSFFRRWRKGK
ncbi:MAG: DUF2179 domain-containing protein [Cyclobacteriaceae bacterium]|nr:DUF2179 domain-containing protein [Cyclobacteriaceae bacterium]